jgi:hypothetical protein
MGDRSTVLAALFVVLVVASIVFIVVGRAINN